MHALLTHEIGSLAKPSWRVKTAAGTPLDERDIDDARRWGERLDVPGYEELVELLERFSGEPDDVAEVGRWSSRYAVRLLESAGLDVVYDGEQQRSEMYAWAVAHANGFEPRGTVRSFDNKYYTKSAVTGPISLAAPYHNDEFAFLRDVAEAELKVPVTGAYTIAVWSYDEYYAPGAAPLGAPPPRAQQLAARREFVVDIARNLIRPNLEALIELGARWLQIDEPGASTEPDELDLFVEGFTASVERLDGAILSTQLRLRD